MESKAVVDASAVVEKGTLLCPGSVVNHDAHIMPGCRIDCNAVVASGATVPEKTKVLSCTVFEKK